MRFSLFMQPVHAPGESPTISFERDLELIEWWDTLGFDEVFIGEHHSSGWELIASPAVFIAAAAARTKRIRLGSGVVPLGLHHPLYVADEYILLDHLTRGRAILGVGAGGGIPSDPYVVGVDASELQPRFTAAFDAMMRLLEDSAPYSVKTDWFELRDAVLQVRPYTRSGLPLAIVTGKNADTLERIGRHRATWLTALPPAQIPEAWAHVEAGARDADVSADRSQIRLNTIVHLADSREQAFEEVRAAAAREHFDFGVPILGRPQPDVARDQWIDVMAQAPNVVIGTPDDAIAKLRTIEADSGGVGGVMLMSKEWASREATLHSYELMARHVFPEFQGALDGITAADQVARNIS